MSKSNADLQLELDTIEKLEHEREISDKLYARKIVETIVFGVVGLITVGFFTVMVRFFISIPSK